MPRYGYGRGYRGYGLNLYSLIDIAIIAGIIYLLISLFLVAAGYVIALIALILLREFLRGRFSWRRMNVWR